MPSIPTVTAPNLTPPPEMNPGIAGKPGTAIAGAADQFASVADYGLQVAERIKKTQDDGIMMNAENQIGADIRQAQAGLHAWNPTLENLSQSTEELKQNTADALREKYQDKYGNRPDLWRYIEPYLGRQLNEFDSKVDVKSADLTASYTTAALDQSATQTIDDAANEPTLDGKNAHWAIEDAKTDLAVRNGVLWPEQAEARKKALRTQTIETEVTRAMNPTNAPEIMDSEIKRLKEYGGLIPAEKLARMQETMGEAYKEAKTRQDKINVSAKANAALADWQKDPTLKDSTGQVNYLEAAKRAGEDSTLSLAEKREQQETAEQQDAIQKRMRAERNQKNMDKLEPRIGDLEHPLTLNEVRSRARLNPADQNWISPETENSLTRIMRAEDRENRVENMQERGILRQDRADKSADIMYDLLAAPGYIADRAELSQSMMKGLSKADENTVWSMKGIGTSKDYENAITMMRQSPIYPNNDTGHRKLGDDLALLRTTVEDKKLTGPQILEAASQIIKPKEEAYHNQTVKALLENIWAGAKSVVTGQPAIAAAAPGSTVPTSRKEYFDGMKKANPGATDEQINKYLDGKGVK